MFNSSNRFDESVTGSHDVATLCNVVHEESGHVATTLDVIGGNVSADSSRKIRRSCSLTLQDPSGQLVPDVVNDLLQPYSGYFIQLYRGISWRDNTKELFPLGTFVPYAPRVVDTGESLAISLAGYDRSKIIGRTRFTQPYVIPSGTNTGLAIRALLDTRIDGLRYNFEPTNTTVPGIVIGLTADHDPWEEAVKIAEADGMELFFDARDIVTLRPIPDPETDPIIRTFADDENCTFTSIERETDADRMYTGVIVYSEGSEIDAPLHVEVWRDDTDLRIPYFFPTALIKTEAQAILTGQSLLRRVGRAEWTVSMSVIPDPRQEVGDVIRAKRDLIKLDDTFVISSITMPLDATTEASITTERRRMAATT